MGPGRAVAVVLAGTVVMPSVALLALAAPFALTAAAPGPPPAGSPAPGGAGMIPPLPTGPAAPDGEALEDIPPGMLALYVGEAAACPGLPWAVLAGIGKVETDHGRADRVSAAGAEGPMQFMPATWSTYGADANGDGTADPWDPPDAVLAAARMLCADGGADPSGLPAAIWRYNHSVAYVEAVLDWAARYSAGG